jgi:hypothetical protein
MKWPLLPRRHTAMAIITPAGRRQAIGKSKRSGLPQPINESGIRATLPVAGARFRDAGSELKLNRHTGPNSEYGYPAISLPEGLVHRNCCCLCNLCRKRHVSCPRRSWPDSGYDRLHLSCRCKSLRTPESGTKPSSSIGGTANPLQARLRRGRARYGTPRRSPEDIR